MEQFIIQAVKNKLGLLEVRPGNRAAPAAGEAFVPGNVAVCAGWNGILADEKAIRAGYQRVRFSIRNDIMEVLDALGEVYGCDLVQTLAAVFSIGLKRIFKAAKLREQSGNVANAGDLELSISGELLTTIDVRANRDGVSREDYLRVVLLCGMKQLERKAGLEGRR